MEEQFKNWLNGSQTHGTITNGKKCFDFIRVSMKNIFYKDDISKNT